MVLFDGAAKVLSERCVNELRPVLVVQGGKEVDVRAVVRSLSSTLGFGWPARWGHELRLRVETVGLKGKLVLTAWVWSEDRDETGRYHKRELASWIPSKACVCKAV